MKKVRKKRRKNRPKVFSIKIREGTDQRSCFAWKAEKITARRNPNCGKMKMKCIALTGLTECNPDYCTFYKTEKQQKDDLEKVRKRLLTLSRREQFLINETYYKNWGETL